MNKKRFATAGMLLVCFLLLIPRGGAVAAALEADMVIYNGKILTTDSPDPDNFRIAQAAALYRDRFLAVGTNDEALQYAGPSTRKIDLGGRTVLPGFVETHQHIYSYGSHFFPQGKPRVGTTNPSIPWTNKAEFLAQLRTYALAKKPGEWIIVSPSGGEGPGIVVALQKGEVTRSDLDQVAPNNPVHITWNVTVEGLVNTKALELLLERYPEIPGVRKDDTGVPTGRLGGVANVTLWYEFWPQIPPEELAPYYKLEMEESAAQGLATISTRLSPNHLAAYSWLHARGELPVRMAYSLETASRSENPSAIASRLVGLQGGSGKHMWGAGDNWLWMIGLTPISIDSVPGNGGSCINKTYPREHPSFPLWLHQFYGPNGLCRLANPEYRDIDLLRAAAQYGFRITAMHSGGDRGIDQFLDAMEELSQQYPDLPQRRWSIDHCRFLNDEHAARSKPLGVVFSCGPKYVYSGERGDIGAFSIIYGREIGEDVVVPFRRLLDHGLRTTIELDQHGFHPLLALEVAVTRKDINGKVWGPQQRVNRREALYMYTRWSAEYVLKENLLGSIEPEKAADFVVLNRDYLTVPEDEIGQIDPVLTVIGGQIAYTEPQFATGSGLPQAGFRGNPTWWWRGIPEDGRERGGEGGM